MASLEGKSTSTTEDRVKTTGEVFTPDSIVNEMLNETDRKLVEYYGVSSVADISDDDYISYIVLEPTCGSGNFLVRELDRKLDRVKNYTGAEQEIALLKAVSSIHGIDITSENIIMSKLRLMEVIETGTTDIFELEYKEKKGFSTTGFKLSDDLKKCIQYILDRNIQCGNTLEYKKILTWKSDLVPSIWLWNKNRINDGLFRNTESTNSIEQTIELVLTQYDFDGNKVALRERTYRNMHEKHESYQNTTHYVDYNKLYTLPEAEVYVTNNINNDAMDDYDF